MEFKSFTPHPPTLGFQMHCLSAFRKLTHICKKITGHERKIFVLYFNGSEIRKYYFNKLTCEKAVLLVLRICPLLVEYLPRHAIAVYHPTDPSATPAAEVFCLSAATLSEKKLFRGIACLVYGKY